MMHFRLALVEGIKGPDMPDLLRKFWAKEESLTKTKLAIEKK